jgi:hypothetical protein
MNTSHLKIFGVSAMLTAGVLAAACSSGNPAGTSTTSGSGGSTGSGTTTGSTGGSGAVTTTASATTGSGGASATTGSGGATSTTGSGGTGGAPSTTIVEKLATVTLALGTTPGMDGGAPSTVLTVTVTDGTTPVFTDVWLYTLTGGVLTPLTGFADPSSKRKYRGYMLPCTIAGMPSGLTPCDNGDLNGVFTDAVRSKLVNGQLVPAADGIVDVTLNAPPVDPIVVVIAREDQRYYGAGAINPDGTVGVVPAGTVMQKTHPLVTYTHDIAPLMTALCVSCHAPGQLNPDHPIDTYDAIVNNNFAYTESVEKCTINNPTDSAELQACIAAITSVQFLAQPGVPALNGFVQRALPDANKGTSPIGLKWYGASGGTKRFDAHGDRRMPPSNSTADAGDDDPTASVYFDDNPADTQVMFNWVAQGCPL